MQFDLDKKEILAIFNSKVREEFIISKETELDRIFNNINNNIRDK